MYATTIIETSFPRAYERILRFVLASPQHIEFGGGVERKPALDSQTHIILTRPAVEEVLAQKYHPKDPFCSPNTIKAYCDEYTEMLDASKFDDTYYDLLVNGFKHVIFKDALGNVNWIPIRIRNFFNYCYEKPINQIEALRIGLQKQIDENLPSNRNIAVLFNPSIGHSNDSKLATPCLNEILIRYEGNGKASTHTLFRSHDMCNAYESNKIAITKMLNDYVIEPCGCKILFDDEVNFSGHIYVNDTDSAKIVADSSTVQTGLIVDRQQYLNDISRGG